MANFKKYVLPYATNYEVNSNGDVHNIKTGRQISPRKDGRVRLTNYLGNRIDISPIYEFNKLHYANGGFGKCWDMGPEFPNYFLKIERQEPVIYSKDNPGVSLTRGKNDRILIMDYMVTRRTVNVYKMLAIYKLGQEDVGPVHIAVYYYGVEGIIPCNAQTCSNANVQIIHKSLVYKDVILIEGYPGYCISFKNESRMGIIYECRTGFQVCPSVVGLPLVNTFDYVEHC